MANVIGGLVLLGFGSIAFLSAQLTGQQPIVKRVPVEQTRVNDGASMYVAYCASCHGLEGRGDGPASRAMKMPPTDLTRLARKNGGQFPTANLYQVLREELNVTAHGSRDMPVWGTIFREMERSDNALVKLRMKNLTAYIESKQAK
jgi:mono/diheme cytochrome c family protein